MYEDNIEDVGRVQAVFLDGASQIVGDNKTHRAGCGNAPHKHGAQCGGRPTRIIAEI